ncbi:3-oxoadipate enol-lactonase [Kribbella sp. NBC_01245]|uniref:3-oxoadipate enol-lactonase n=1 Tax=Kribbella sp. NBC_01245 TaxID=2903578 RepID=UPI002E283C39|nr:3-oxoadipate enol-lactonase [Kribbella sp. NBC_01245]
MALNYLATGPANAPVVLLGSALGTTHLLWQAQVDALAGRFRVVAFDHLGHGASPVPHGPYSMADLGREVLALLDHLGVEQASYAGISIGGMVGLWLAENAPERFKSFAILCAPALPGGGPQMWTDRADLVRREGAQAVADAAIGRWFLPAFATANPGLVAAVRHQVVNTPAEGYAACSEAIRDMDLTGGLASIDVPTLLIAADQDESVPVDAVRAVADQIPGAKFELIENSAHLVNLAHPEHVTTLLAHHLR